MTHSERKIILENQLRGIVIDAELVQRRRGSVHMLRKPSPAWAVGDDVLSVARTLGAVRVRIVDTEDGAEYCADLATLDAQGRRVDWGHGAQTALDLRHWRIQRTAQPEPTTAATAQAVQASLFA